MSLALALEIGSGVGVGVDRFRSGGGELSGRLPKAPEPQEVQEICLVSRHA